MKRRQLLAAGMGGMGQVALAALLGGGAAARPGPQFTPRAKRVVWLFMAGAPSQLDLFDHKPALAARYDEDLPDSVRNAQRLGMSAGQGRFPVAPSRFRFQQHGQSGTWVSELLPETARMVDEIAVVKTLTTESINHEPAALYINTGSQVGNRPSVGAWLSYGLGSLNENLPVFAVMTSRYSQKNNVQALSPRLWSNGFLPAEHGGVTVRGGPEPLLYLQDPPGIDRGVRRTMLDGVGAMNRLQAERMGGDPRIADRVAQYEMAFRMQSAVPELADFSGETAATRALYGEEVDTPGTFASNCLAARRMLERGVRFVQIYHRGWDSHQQLPARHAAQCRDVDRACYGLITDMKSRGLLEDTLVLWGGEFGRTVYCQGPLTPEDYGRDHHPRCFSMWLAGAGIKPGITYGETDDYSYNVARDPVHLRDLHATILHLCGLDPVRLSVRYQGLDQRLIAVGNTARVVTELFT